MARVTFARTTEYNHGRQLRASSWRFTPNHGRMVATSRRVWIADDLVPDSYSGAYGDKIRATQRIS